MEKYTGRKLAELRKAPVSSYTGEELEYFNRMTTNPETGPGTVARAFRNTILVGKHGFRQIGEFAVKASNSISEAAKREEEIDAINTAKDKLYRKSALETALLIGDCTQEEYEEALEELNS